MAENISGTREIGSIIEELLEALKKYSKVRHVQYSMTRWRDFGYPLREIKGASQYFSRAFLKGVPVEQADAALLKEGFERLGYAVTKGCHGRCKNLVEELNDAFKKKGIVPVSNIEVFLDMMTFDPHPPYNADRCDGNTILDPDYHFEILLFDDEEKLKIFSAEAKRLIKNGKILSLGDIYKMARYKARVRNISKRMIDL